MHQQAHDTSVQKGSQAQRGLVSPDKARCNLHQSLQAFPGQLQDCCVCNTVHAQTRSEASLGQSPGDRVPTCWTMTYIATHPLLTCGQVEAARLPAIPAVQQIQLLRFDTLMVVEVHGLQLLVLCPLENICWNRSLDVQTGQHLALGICWKRRFVAHELQRCYQGHHC